MIRLPRKPAPVTTKNARSRRASRGLPSRNETSGFPGVAGSATGPGKRRASRRLTVEPPRPRRSRATRWSSWRAISRSPSCIPTDRGRLGFRAGPTTPICRTTSAWSCATAPPAPPCSKPPVFEIRSDCAAVLLQARRHALLPGAAARFTRLPAEEQSAVIGKRPPEGHHPHRRAVVDRAALRSRDGGLDDVPELRRHRHRPSRPVARRRALHRRARGRGGHHRPARRDAGGRARDPPRHAGRRRADPARRRGRPHRHRQGAGGSAGVAVSPSRRALPRGDRAADRGLADGRQGPAAGGDVGGGPGAGIASGRSAMFGNCRRSPACRRSCSRRRPPC